jgi:hypothetical protein
MTLLILNKHKGFTINASRKEIYSIVNYVTLLKLSSLVDSITKICYAFLVPLESYKFSTPFLLKGIVSPDWKGLQMVSLDRFEV